jgi:hypothetical protein
LKRAEATSRHQSTALARDHAAPGTARDQDSEFLPRCSEGGVHVGRLRAPVLTLLPWPAACAVEDLLDGTQRDAIVIGTNQETEPDERFSS